MTKYFYEYDPKAINQKNPWRKVQVRWWHPRDWWRYANYRFNGLH